MQHVDSPLSLPSDRDASGRDLGDKEVGHVEEAIRSGILNATSGVFAKRFEWAFALRMGVAHAVACSSGSAAVHAAVAALDLDEGDEVITPPVTDMGAILPILYESAVPVFADVDPDTGNVTAETLAARITARTRALVVTHLFGLPCELGPILELADARGLRVIEDCAQAPLAEDDGVLVGAAGDLACFSFQQGKHMTTGEGGIVMSADAQLAGRARRFVNKGWGYGDDQPDHDRPGLNYRMTELQAAVGQAQLDKLDDVVEQRRTSAAMLCDLLRDVAGLRVAPLREGAAHSWWRVCLLVDAEVVTGGADSLAAALAELGVPARAHYLPRLAFECGVFRDWRRFPVVRRPFVAAGRTPPVSRMGFPGASRFLAQVLVLPWNEFYHEHHVELIAEAVRRSREGLRS